MGPGQDALDIALALEIMQAVFGSRVTVLILFSVSLDKPVETNGFY